MKKIETSIITVVMGTGKGWCEIIKYLLNENAMVIVPAKNFEVFNQLIQHPKVTTGKLVTLLTDISDYQKASELLNDIVVKYGKIDLAVAVFESATMNHNTSLIDFKCSEFEQIINDNITNYFMASRLLLHLMKKNRHGVYISISNYIVENENIFYPINSCIERIKAEMSKIFAKEVFADGVRYYHLSTGNSPKEQNYNNQVDKRISNITGIGSSVFNLFKGNVPCPEEVFQCIS